LAQNELGYLHVVGAEVSGNQTVQLQEGEKVADVLGFTRPLWPHALVAAGSYDMARADAALRSGQADVIAFGRDFIGNPDLVERLRRGKPLVERRPADWYGAGEEGYTDYRRWDGSPASQGAMQ
jgi:N-ethylmaleimide reductase